MADTAIKIPFHGDTLYLIDINGEPFVPMKPIVEGMGMVWAAQFVKLKQRFAKGISEIEMPSNGGRQMMICLAFRKFAAWLSTIQPNKVKPEIRDKVMQYQEECDDVLYEYWINGQVTNKRKKTTVDQRTPLRDAINMLVSKKHLLYPEAYALIHQRFNVEHIDELPITDLPEAIEYVHKIAFEGEYLQKQPNTIPFPTLPIRGIIALHSDGSEVVRSEFLPEGATVATLDQFEGLVRHRGGVVLWDEMQQREFVRQKAMMRL